MPRLRVVLGFGLALVAVLAVVGAAVYVPLMSARDIRQTVSQGHSIAARNCWGCTPYDRLRSIFRLQEMAAEPRINHFERRLETAHLTLGERNAAEAELQEAQVRLAAAVAARTALDDAIERCRADAACRVAPAAFHVQTCTGPWPSEATEARVSSLARRIYASGAECRDLSCPSVNCAAREQLQAMVEELTDTFAAYGAAPSRGNVSYAELAPVLEGLRQALERLPLVLSQLDELSVATWAEDVSASGILQLTDEWSNSSGPEVGWRLRMARLQLGALVSQALSQVENQESESTEGLAAPVDWPRLAERAGSALAQVHYLEWLITLEGGTSTCEAPRTETIVALAGELRRAAAALSVCGARAGCGDGRGTPPLADLYARAPAGLGGLDRFTAEALAVMTRQFDAMALTPDVPVRLTTDLESYGAGEAIRVSFGGTANRCIAEPGAQLGMFNAGDFDVPLEMRTVRTTGDGNEALIAAPNSSGVFEIRAFASSARGGGELSRERIVVEPAPEGCVGYTGLWDTSFGMLRLYERDGSVRGTYSRAPELPPGFLTGTLRGDVLYGEWESELGEGGARLALSEDGTYFRGSWSHIPGRFTGTGAWNGTCAAPETEEDASTSE